MHAKVFSIQIFQYLRQIPPRVCTLVLFIDLVIMSAPQFLHECVTIPPLTNSDHLGISLKVKSNIIESVDSISRDERGFPLTQYITNG